MLGIRVEFKKPNNYNRGRPARTVPQHDDVRSIDLQPIKRPTPATKRQPVAEKVTENPRRPRPRFAKPSKRTAILVAVTIASLFLIVTVALVTNRSIAPISEPDYPTVLPDSKSIGELGGWKRVSPPKADPVFAYDDSIDSVPISVSQQPLPKSFASDTESHMSDVAKGFNATTKLAAGSTTVYIGTSVKGPQSAIFTKNNLLILIKSEKVVSDKSWITYITSLQ